VNWIEVQRYRVRRPFLPVQSELIMLYQSRNTFRVIPIDGRAHDPIKSQDTTWYGDAVESSVWSTLSSSCVSTGSTLRRKAGEVIPSARAEP
jgi:hypothetical protein